MSYNIHDGFNQGDRPKCQQINSSLLLNKLFIIRMKCKYKLLNLLLKVPFLPWVSNHLSNAYFFQHCNNQLELHHNCSRRFCCPHIFLTLIFPSRSSISVNVFTLVIYFVSCNNLFLLTSHFKYSALHSDHYNLITSAGTPLL